MKSDMIINNNLLYWKSF